MLAVVQHEQGRFVPERAEHPAAQVGDDGVAQGPGAADLGDPEQGSERGDDVLARGQRGQLEHHDPAVLGRGGRDRLREPGLAEPTGTEHGDQPSTGQEVGDGGDVGLPSDQRGGRAPQADAPDGAGGRGGPTQQVGVQTDEVCGRVGAQAVGQTFPVVGEDGECLGRPAGGGERTHRSADGDLVERVGCRVLAPQLGGGSGVPGGQQCGAECAPESAADAAGTFGERRAQVAVDIGAGVAAPERQRVFDGRAVLPADQAFRQVEVDVVGADGERVAGGRRDDQTVGRAPAQP